MKNNLQELDLEWVALIAEAKNIGLKKEDILNFLAGQPAVDLIADNG
ncbi:MULTISPECIES: anti-repressor SinI family protein [Bacillaceae]|uniref:DNA-binding anti-repressor SinI n=1 Tax=Bacillus infantis TaxID=324767 RepID=A0A5D4SEL4_9BACI|nr:MULTISPECIES: anti-repressor SinI family protein [Bacillus]MCA1035631.1 anti-repressor SinI family protein [Bacillus infantis]MCK6208145.1 anti-repressor SinI family protein [Bacillus infantis]MCP1156933.1 anti-repressor SinI family protein [Bacillus infantis]MDT0160750.1 anti-repressor SinI family protein [Bacillus sp. AG4(2022)]MDW2878206.1 anti-repressor SinI family protein [Bacillus infantis]